MTLAERAVARVLAGGVGALAAGVAGATVAVASGLVDLWAARRGTSRHRDSGRRGPSRWAVGLPSR